jgi:hypothetical protein
MLVSVCLFILWLWRAHTLASPESLMYKRIIHFLWTLCNGSLLNYTSVNPVLHMWFRIVASHLIDFFYHGVFFFAF